MLNWLLLYAGVHLAAAFVFTLSALARRPRPARQLLLAAVPAPCALCIVVAFFYLRATMPPPSVVLGLSGHPIVLRHGNSDWQIWDEQLSMVDIAALGLTVVTLLALVIVGLIYGHHARRRRGHIV